MPQDPPAGERRDEPLVTTDDGVTVYPDAFTRDRARVDEQVVTLAEERAHISRRLVERGIVRVSTRTEVVDHVERADLEYQTATVTRHPVNRFVETMPPTREEDDVLILPVVEERLVVEKRLFVTEEIHIHRNRATEEVELPVSLRRQYAVVERLDPDGAPRDEP